jgi:hypothetical protein
MAKKAAKTVAKKQSDEKVAAPSPVGSTPKATGSATKAQAATPAAKRTAASARKASARNPVPPSTTGRRSAKKPSPAPKSGKLPARYQMLMADAAQALAPAPLPQPRRGDAINLGPIAGTGSSTKALGVGATDLCEIAPCGRVALAGDTFTGDAAYSGTWSPSVGLRVLGGSLHSAEIRFDSAFGKGGTLYDETWPHVPGGSQLPAGTVQVFGIDYALVTRTANLIPIDSRVVVINPNPGAGPWWTVPGSLRPASWQDGNETQISGCQAPDGWVYIVADGFARDRSVRLYHCRAETFTDRNTWWAWGKRDGQWQWNVEPEPLSNDHFGELSLRLIEGKFVLSGFNQSTGNVEVRVADDVTQVLAPATPVTVVATQKTVPQNYGGFLVPGCTLDQAVILVSQWNTRTNTPYNVQQFVVNLNR